MEKKAKLQVREATATSKEKKDKSSVLFLSVVVVIF